MVTRENAVVRPLAPGDVATVRRILDTSEYVHVRVAPDELERVVRTLPGVGLYSLPTGPLARVTGGSLQGLLQVNWLVPPRAWLGIFATTWSQGPRFLEYLDRLLPALEAAVAARGARTLCYSGTDVEADWLLPPLRERGFELRTLLRSYDKTDLRVPAPGNAAVHLRPFQAADVAELVALEQRCFPPLWQHDAASFLEVAATYPYFVVAEEGGRILGYQFNAVDATTGYLVRIAVHPEAEGRGIGTRLLAEAVAYFAASGVRTILLNSEETNTRAHALYERFGFVRVPPQGFVLERTFAGMPPP